MQMLYNSDGYAVMQFDLPRPGEDAAVPTGGVEIVDKRGRKDIWLQGPLAERFQRGVQRIVDEGTPGEALQEALEDFIAGYATHAPQALVLH